jgi:hypothetical protein
MRIRILGGGWYGCTIALHLLEAGHDVTLDETSDRLFSGASGGNPARLHLGFHYPRSGATMRACLEHQDEFLKRFGFLTRAIPVNLYAIADRDSLVDFEQYRRAFEGRVQFVDVEASAYGLRNVEGALLTGERHIVIDNARAFFTDTLGGLVTYDAGFVKVDDPRFDLTVDCTFCANDDANIERFEPCVTALLKGPTDRATTIMDGPFGSIYPWNEDFGLSSLTSASLTPLTKTCRSHAEARAMLDALNFRDLNIRADKMLDQMAHFWPDCRDLYKVADFKLTIRAMPRSAADTRLVDVVRVGKKALRVRAGKIDAIFHAARIVEGYIKTMGREAE